MMISEFSTFGSSVSKHIFNKKVNKDMDDDFLINYSLEEVNLISLMSEPIDFDESLLNSSHEYDNICVRQDLTKDFLDFLKNDDTVEYLIMDTFNDVELKIIKVDDGRYITGSSRLRKVEYYNLIKDNAQLDIHSDFDEYIELWKDSCDRFFEFLSENRPDIKVILNMARLCYRYAENGKIAESKSFKAKSKDNELRDILDYHIIENYDVEVLKFSKDTLIDRNHVFGFFPTHYEPSYFTQKNKQLSQIIEKNTLYDYNSNVNVRLREIDRKELIFEKEYKKYKVKDIQ